jgi:hypothetical protein
MARPYRTMAKNVPTNQLLKVKKTGTPAEKIFSNVVETFQISKALIPYRHDAYLENDFKRQPLMLSMYSSVACFSQSRC